MWLSRLWKVELGDTVDSLTEAISSIRGNMDKLPLEVYGRILTPDQKIADINVADNEQLILEWKIVLSEEDRKAWAFDPKNKKSRKIGMYASRLPKEV